MPNGLDPVPDPPSTIDSELAARVARGDRQAETTFVRRHQRAVTLVLQTRVQADRVHDLTQETFIVVIARMRDNGIHDPNRIGGFLRQTAINLANSDRRKYLRQRTDNDNDSIDIVIDEALGPADSMELEQLVSMIGLLMDELPMERDRDLLQRYIVHGQDKISLCRLYGLSSEHFDRVLHRARVRLKELLDKRSGAH
jgi:RNA polymerase sigma factor (sigma-70 family)